MLEQNQPASHTMIVPHYRCPAKWPDREIFCISDLTTCSASGQDRPSAETGERSSGYSDVVVCPGNVNAGPLQHLPPSLPSDVHFCNIRHEFLHDGQTERNSGRSLQLPNLRPEHDPPLPDVDLGGLGRRPQWDHGREGLRAWWVGSVRTWYLGISGKLRRLRLKLAELCSIK